MSYAYLNKPENDASRVPNPFVFVAIPCIAEKRRQDMLCFTFGDVD